jgi:hypothetical protein
MPPVLIVAAIPVITAVVTEVPIAVAVPAMIVIDPPAIAFPIS